MQLTATNKDTKYFPIVIQNEKFSKLFAVQTKPEEKYFLKGKEISLEKLMQLLEQIDY